MERFQAITRHHQFQPEGNCHLDTLSWSSGHFHASKSETVCRTAGRSPRFPPAPWTLPRLQPVASLERLLRSAGHQESPLRRAGRRDLEAGKPQLSPWSSSRKLSREKLLHWRQPPQAQICFAIHITCWCQVFGLTYYYHEESFPKYLVGYCHIGPKN